MRNCFCGEHQPYDSELPPVKLLRMFHSFGFTGQIMNCQSMGLSFSNFFFKTAFLKQLEVQSDEVRHLIQIGSVQAGGNAWLPSPDWRLEVKLLQ